MTKRRILLTGASGFIGQHAAQSLVASGFSVFASTRQAQDSRNLTPNIEWIEADLLEPSGASRLVRSARCATLLHLGWDVSPGFWTATSNLDWLAASLWLAKVFRESGGQRIVIAGTCAEYDWSAKSAQTKNLNENTDRFCPATLYAQSKLSLRNVLSQWCATNNISFAAGLLFFLYGANEHPLRLVPSVIRSLLAGEVVQTTTGHQIRDYIDTRDAGHALAALAASNIAGTVNIGSGEGKTIRDIVSLLLKQINPAAEITFGSLPNHPDDPPRLVADINRLQNEVGFTPELSLDQGLKDCVAWWRNK